MTTKAKEILALSYKNCEGLIEEGSRLEDAVLYAINEALSGSCSHQWYQYAENVLLCLKCEEKKITDKKQQH
jgi:hypothetical protein